MNNLSALPYYGGKSANDHGYGTGRWINSLLPTERDVLYCEPCGCVALVCLDIPANPERTVRLPLRDSRLAA